MGVINSAELKLFSPNDICGGNNKRGSPSIDRSLQSFLLLCLSSLLTAYKCRPCWWSRLILSASLLTWYAWMLRTFQTGRKAPLWKIMQQKLHACFLHASRTVKKSFEKTKLCAIYVVIFCSLPIILMYFVVQYYHIKGTEYCNYSRRHIHTHTENSLDNQNRQSKWCERG